MFDVGSRQNMTDMDSNLTGYNWIHSYRAGLSALLSFLSVLATCGSLSWLHVTLSYHIDLKRMVNEQMSWIAIIENRSHVRQLFATFPV